MKKHYFRVNYKELGLFILGKLRRIPGRQVCDAVDRVTPLQTLSQGGLGALSEDPLF